MWTPLVVQQFRLHASTAEVMSSTLVLETRSFMPRDRRLPSWHNGKESAHQRKRHGFNPWLGMIPWSRKWQLAPVFLPGKFHGKRSLVGQRELDTAEHTEHPTSKTNKQTKNDWWGASLVVQWIRICLAMQGTPIWSLGCDDPTCHGATKLICHDYWACAPQQEKPPQWEVQAPQQSSPHSPQLEKAHVQSNKSPELPPPPKKKKTTDGLNF